MCHSRWATIAAIATKLPDGFWLRVEDLWNGSICETGRRSADIFLRGACSFGVLPANGLLYDPPDPCICGTERKLRGFCALASKRVSGVGVQASEPKLRKSSAYKLQPPASSRQSDAAWPRLSP